MPVGSPWPLIYTLVSLGLLWLTARIAIRLRYETLPLARLQQYFLGSVAIFIALVCIKITAPHSIVGYLAPLWLMSLAVIVARCSLEHYCVRTGRRQSWIALASRPSEWIPPYSSVRAVP